MNSSRKPLRSQHALNKQTQHQIATKPFSKSNPKKTSRTTGTSNAHQISNHLIISRLNSLDTKRTQLAATHEQNVPRQELTKHEPARTAPRLRTIRKIEPIFEVEAGTEGTTRSNSRTPILIELKSTQKPTNQTRTSIHHGQSQDALRMPNNSSQQQQSIMPTPKLQSKPNPEHELQTTTNSFSETNP
ncbi:hypothetical protein Droror1_Dr00003618 [Drosera rotundifolia]